MTVPSERRRAVNTAREFLWSLIDRTLTPGVPARVRALAHRLLKHYPCDADLTGPAFTEDDLP